MKARKVIKKKSSGRKMKTSSRGRSGKSKSSKVKKLMKLSKGGKMVAKKKHKKK
jgi:hypothetical protein